MHIIRDWFQSGVDIVLYGPFFVFLIIMPLATLGLWRGRSAESNRRAVSEFLGTCLFFYVLRQGENAEGVRALLLWLAPLTVAALLLTYLAIPLLIVRIADRWDRSYQRDNRTSDDVHYIKVKIEENVEARERANHPNAESHGPALPLDRR